MSAAPQMTTEDIDVELNNSVLANFISHLQSIQDACPPNVTPQIVFNVGGCQDGDYYCDVTVSYPRMESQAEADMRWRNAQHMTEYRRAQYEKLKAEFEPS